MDTKKILFIFGTRPEAIKLAPLIWEINNSNSMESVICSTGQHVEMVEKIMSFFKLKTDYNLNSMQKNQSLAYLSSFLINKLESVISLIKPSMVVVQGDTTSAMTGALSAFYHKIPIAHIEAGLRSHNNYSPFPEEANRKIISQLATFHFAPTEKSCKNLIFEGVAKDCIFTVGNTVIDSLLYSVEKVKNASWQRYLPQIDEIDFRKKIILVTGHRRESFGEPFKNIFRALIKIAETENVEIVYPVHLNPNVKEDAYRMLSNSQNVNLIDPLGYPEFVYLMHKSYLILTDSGGIQEEAPTLNKPVLIMREVTERTEGIEAGVAKLVGTCMNTIIRETKKLLNSEHEYYAMANKANPYGDGKSAKKIADILEKKSQ